MRERVRKTTENDIRRRSARLPHGARPRGFTLVELLVVIGVIAVIVAFSVPAFRSMVGGARRSREMNAARQLIVAWTSYAADAKGQVLPGFKTGLPAYQANGDPIPASSYGGGATISARYPWRIARYLGHNFHGLYVNDQEPELSLLENGDYQKYLYFGSLYPSFGMNSTWVGGDQERYGFLPPPPPNSPPSPFNNFYVSRLSQVKHAERLLVFASARTDATSDGRMVEGYFRIDSPAIISTQWASTYDPAAPSSYGNVSARQDGETVCAFVGGNVDHKPVDELRDMRYWANQADAPEWRLVPGS